MPGVVQCALWEANVSIKVWRNATYRKCAVGGTSAKEAHTKARGGMFTQAKRNAAACSRFKNSRYARGG